MYPAVGDDTCLLPLEQHLPVIGDLVLPLLCPQEAIGVYVLEPDEDTFHSGVFNILR